MTDDSALTLTTADQVDLAADVVAGSRTDLAAVVCHPHPSYGGSRHDHVVTAVYRAFGRAGVTTIRFDFRTDHGGGEPERLDVIAAIDAVADRVPGAGIVLAGYSFGADVSLTIDDARIAAWFAVAPPLALFAPERFVFDDPRPKTLLSPAHDQFAPPDRVRSTVAHWAAADVIEIPLADHFLAGASQRVADEAEALVAALGAR